ncbi:MAG: type II secretion system F family protein [Acidobacteriaceae bacterium]|nr:type II secretion system F family protein [Acidobacteriaceae bacterium]
MLRFTYEAVNADGSEVTGQIEAETERGAQRELRRRGLVPVGIREASAADSAASAGGRRKKSRKSTKNQDRINTLKELTVLLEAGVNLPSAIQSLAETRAQADLAEALTAVGRDLRQGRKLSVAMRANMPNLPGYIYQLIEAGEMTGQLRNSMRDGVAQMEYEERIRNDLRNALVYPSVLVFSGVGAVSFIFIVVVPRFADMFKNNPKSLPWLSKVVLNTGMFVRGNILAVGLVAFLLVLIGTMLLRRRSVQQWLFELSMSVPLLGPWLMEAETGRWSSMLSTLLTNKIPLLGSLELARGALRSVAMQARLGQVERSVRSGMPVAKALEEYSHFGATIVNLVRVGEKAGNLPEMLRSAATLCEQTGRDRMKRLLLLIEPAAILIIGAVIGVIMTAIILAITSISDIPL